MNPVPDIKQLREVWPNFRVKDQRFNWNPGPIEIE